jgi:hypothetical protein
MKEVDQNRDSADRRLDRLNTSISNLQTSVKAIFSKLDEQDKKKADALKVEALLKRIDGFANVEHIKQLKDFFLPKIEEFAAKIDHYEGSNESVKECIVKFDQDISLKASKTEILKRETKLLGMLVHNEAKEELECRMRGIESLFQKEAEERKEDFEQFKAARQESFEADMIHLFATRFQKYEKVEKSFSKFFNTEELQVSLDCKADNEMITQLDQSKASKKEVK